VALLFVYAEQLYSGALLMWKECGNSSPRLKAGAPLPQLVEVPDAPSSSQQLPGVFMLAQSGSGALPYALDGQEGP
jgi:hypothetical protein